MCLPCPQAAVLLLADAQGDTGLMLEAFEALEQGGAVPQVRSVGAGVPVGRAQ